jgi:hypothetical protein
MPFLHGFPHFHAFKQLSCQRMFEILDKFHRDAIIEERRHFKYFELEMQEF